MVRYVVKLTEEERAALQAMVSRGKAAARKLTHARILLNADAAPEGIGRTDQEIHETLGVGLSTIYRVRQRFVEESFDAAIHPRPAPPRPGKRKIPQEVEKQLVTLACSDPPEGRCCWTLELLGDRLVELKLVESVSRETVRQALKKRRDAVAGEDVVHSARGGRGFRVPHGGRAADCIKSPTTRNARWCAWTRPRSN
jgi:transposase